MFSVEGLHRAHLRSAEQHDIFPSSSEAHISQSDGKMPKRLMQIVQ